MNRREMILGTLGAAVGAALPTQIPNWQPMRDVKTKITLHYINGSVSTIICDTWKRSAEVVSHYLANRAGLDSLTIENPEWERLRPIPVGVIEIDDQGNPL